MHVRSTIMKNEELKTKLREKFKCCPEAILKRLESMVDAGLFGENATSLSDEEMSRRCAKIYHLTDNDRKEIIAKIDIIKIASIVNA